MLKIEDLKVGEVREKLVDSLCELYKGLWEELIPSDKSDQILIIYCYNSILVHEDEDPEKSILTVKLIMKLCKLHLEDIGQPYKVIPVVYLRRCSLGILDNDIFNKDSSEYDYYLSILKFLTIYCITNKNKYLLFDKRIIQRNIVVEGDYNENKT